MNETTSRTIELRFNEFHQPVVIKPSAGRIVLQVAEPATNHETKQVKISGTPEALHTLGVLLIGIAETPGFHVHIDEQADGSWFQCTNGFTLTFENTAKPKHKDKRTTDTPPPEWAR